MLGCGKLIYDWGRKSSKKTTVAPFSSSYLIIFRVMHSIREWIRSLIGRLTRGIVLWLNATSSYKTSLSVAFRGGGGQTETERNGRANHNLCFQPTLTWRYLTGGRGDRGWGGERKLTGIRPYLFHFLTTPPRLLAGVCVQMSISVSHSSSPNWHLTAAPHGLLAGCVSARFSQRRKRQRSIKHHPAERALSPAPVAPFPLPPPLLRSLPLQLSHAGSSLHPRQPQALIIAFLSRPVALKSTPPPPFRCPPPPPSSPPALPLQKSSMKKMSGYWRCSASRLWAKRDGAYGRHMATFSKSYLYLTRPINHGQISCSPLMAGQKACSRTDVGGKFARFYFL